MILKKYCFSFIVTVLCFSGLYGQQLEHYTQYQYNQFILNPALTSQKKCIDVKGGYRYQWVGIEGAPRSAFFSTTAPLKLGRKSRSAYAPKHGIGVQIRRDLLGPWTKSEMHIAYSVKVRVSRYSTISYGVSAGMKQLGFDASAVSTVSPDPTIVNSQRSLIFPDAKVGIWLTTKKSYFGLAIHNLFGNAMKNIGSDNRFQRHFYFTMGKRFKMENDWHLIPSLLLSKTIATPMDGHLSVLFDYNNAFAFGVGLRRTDAITAQMRFKLLNIISIGYSFDYIISKLQNNSWQSQEISMSYNSCSNYGQSGRVGCPTFE